MPTYEYACRKCGQHLEVVQSFKDDPLTVCPNCRGRLRKVFGNIGISFKGSGFYKTDSRGKSSSAAAAKSDKAESAASTGGDTTASTGSKASDSPASASGSTAASKSSTAAS